MRLHFPAFTIACFFTCCTLIQCKEAVKEKSDGEEQPSVAVNNKNANPYVPLDQSPMDMIYFPVEYPINSMNNQISAPLVARVIYSRPHKKNRIIFSEAVSALCRYGQPWRLGANEATEITFYQNVSIDGHTLPKGSYTLYCIPQKDKWTIVFNSSLNTWGLHMDESKDIFRTEIPVSVQEPAVEDYTMFFTPAADGADLNMVWDNVKAKLSIAFAG